MGPRPISRGVVELPICVLPQDLASMGPRPISRGVNYSPIALWRRGITLQWGRDRSVAEWTSDRSARRGPQGGFNGAATDQSRSEPNPASKMAAKQLLQWGRDRSVAE